MFDLIRTDPRFYLINKHPGVSFHRQGDEAGLIETLRQVLNDDALWPVHRLDRLTSGLVLVARSVEVARDLSAAFAGRRVEKVYLALSDRKPARKQGLIKGDMEKGRGGAWRLTPGDENPALTRFVSTSLRPGLRLFILRPETGKTHQLRVALKSLGAPILGDTLYRGSESDRGYLHAYALSFELDGERQRYYCPPSAGAAFLLPELRAQLPGIQLR
ncbi:TIGR01621 family pseudouridine synthase [Paludibacterium yongneupense]|uniref:TIGR01621 family pseudouridine synthase n=1 Tax=Paludibacterium yongneupense TaxID=400061 RepID=UPI0003FA3EF8|nr:TIGR01621 family pseudouridine synthase [Paludibacterium yongneupense]